MRPAFYLENKNIPTIDFRRTELGNPGCGGTEYLFAATPYYLARQSDGSCQPVLLANDIARLPNNVETAQVKDVYDAARKAKGLGADVFIYRPYYNNKNIDILDLIDKLQLPTVGWAHVSLQSYYLRKMASSAYFKVLVCVEHEQYDQVQDTLLAAKKKATFIVNGFDVDKFRLENPPEKDERLVVYLGALVPQKGFHLLAKVWKRVLERVPDARLTVIGSGALHNHASKLGSWGVADSDYEKRYIIPCLGNDNGKPHPSVHFAGNLGLEKKEILHRALIGVPNPTGVTENCSGSALELQACGTAIVSGAYWGMLDTIEHGITGLLGKTEQDLVDNICTFLEKPEKAKCVGVKGINFVRQKYNWDGVITNWVSLFDNIIHDRPLHRIPFKNNFKDHYKWIIFLNRFLQIYLGRFIFYPSLLEIRESIISVRSVLKLYFRPK